MYKIAVLGDKDSIYGFATLGLDVFPVRDAEEGANELRKLVAGDYAIVYITEKLKREIQAEIDKYMDLALPAIIQIPGVSGNSGDGLEQIKKLVIKAVGSDII